MEFIIIYKGKNDHRWSHSTAFDELVATALSNLPFYHRSIPHMHGFIFVFIGPYLIFMV